MQIITDENTKIENNLVLPVLAVRGLVFFPGMMLQFDVARKKSILAVSEALSKDRLIFLVTSLLLGSFATYYKCFSKNVNLIIPSGVLLPGHSSMLSLMGSDHPEVSKGY